MREGLPRRPARSPGAACLPAVPHGEGSAGLNTLMSLAAAAATAGVPVDT